MNVICAMQSTTKRRKNKSFEVKVNRIAKNEKKI